jgi:hypothetical protein
MSAVPVPSDEDLRRFLLGSLPAEQVEVVRAWLDADPARAECLDGLAARDPLLDAFTAPGDHDTLSPGSLERVARAVAEALRQGPLDETPDSSRPDGTIVTSRPSVWPPVRLGQFRIVRELGHGGMGYVFEAEDEKLGRHVAIKVLTPELASRPDATKRFLREARAAATVEHENVVPILHVGENGGVPYIVMPLLKGESLQARLKRDVKLPTADVLRIGCDVATGLAAAHDRGLVHRDMKPANVWLDADSGRARVLDFGLAKLSDGADALTDSRALMGTPAYIAPELLDGNPATARTDLFSLGATLYECATGAKAFDGPSITAIFNAVNACRPKPPIEANPDVPPALSALILRLLSRNPSERPADARAVAETLALQPTTPDPATVTWTPAVHPSTAVAQTRQPRQIQIGCVITVSLCLLVAVGYGAMSRYAAMQRELAERERPAERDAAEAQARLAREDALRKALEAEASKAMQKVVSKAQYRGRVDVKVARTIDGRERLLRLNEEGALPLRLKDAFVIEAEVDPPAYVYVVWVDPDHDVTPVYPWNPGKGWNTRPAKEEPVGRLTLPPNVKNRYTAPDAKPGLATMVMFARPTPLDVPDTEVERWFKQLPEIALPGGKETAAVWFENFAERTDPNAQRTFTETESNDTFIVWQSQLQKAMAGKASFQAAVSFARVGNK